MEKNFSVEKSTADKTGLKNYIAAKAAANETMAKTLSDFLSENKDYSALAIVPDESLLYGAGITLSAKKYFKDVSYNSFYIKNASSCPEELPAEDKDIAGFVWYIDNTPAADDDKLPEPSVLKNKNLNLTETGTTDRTKDITHSEAGKTGGVK